MALKRSSESKEYNDTWSMVIMKLKKHNIYIILGCIF